MITSLTYPKITVVTPNYNQAKFIEQTIQSVINQNYPNLEYIIIDGGSTDESVDIIEKYNRQLSYWVSEKDAGMYDAINKGFLRSSGEIMCWINSDDLLWEGALHYVARVFRNRENIHWLQGYPSVIDETGALIYQREPVHSKFHFYLSRYIKTFSFIQQESTFWSRSLWERTGGFLDVTYTLAADFDLWMRFFENEQLYCTKKQLAAFRKREGQKSSDSNKYLKEAKRSVGTHFKKLNFIDKMNIRCHKLFHLKSIKKLDYIAD